jgi:hypothetical protein
MSGLAKPAAKGARLQSIMDGNPSQSRPLISLAYSYNRPFIARQWRRHCCFFPET